MGWFEEPVSQIFSAIAPSVPCNNGIIGGFSVLFHGYDEHKVLNSSKTHSFGFDKLSPDRVVLQVWELKTFSDILLAAIR